jgi:hypothetical protein
VDKWASKLEEMGETERALLMMADTKKKERKAAARCEG